MQKTVSQYWVGDPWLVPSKTGRREPGSYLLGENRLAMGLCNYVHPCDERNILDGSPDVGPPRSREISNGQPRTLACAEYPGQERSSLCPSNKGKFAPPPGVRRT